MAVNDRKKKKTSRAIKAEKSRERIYDAAFSLIAEKGFNETSIADICRKADCSVGAFYHHFPSKDSILEETFRLADIDDDRWSILNQSDLSGKDQVLMYMASYADLVLETGLDFTKRFYNNGNKTFIKKGRPMHTRLVRIISTAVEKGDLTVKDSPEAVCEKIFMCARGVVFHWCLHEGDFDLKSEMLEMVESVLCGQEMIN